MVAKFKTLKDLHNLKGKVCLVRVDFNVPFYESGNVAEDTRIRAHLPTIEFLLKVGAKVVLMSHLGNPEGTLQPVAERLSVLLNKGITFIDDCIGEKVSKTIKNMNNGGIILLENLRQHAGEKENDEEFSKTLASYCDVYINDAFATAHRKHASTFGIAKYVKEKAAGLLMEIELNTLSSVLETNERPLVIIIGGAKVSSKLGVLKKFATLADTILIGGAMANTFLKAMNVNMAKSFVEDDMLSEAINVLNIANSHNCKIILPSDVTVANRLEPHIETENPNVNSLENNQMALDIGKHTQAVWAEMLKNAGTILWNGPAGVFEVEPFHLGTKAVAEAVAKSPAFKIIGGGDTIHAINMFGIKDKVNYISTGGGSLLEYLEGKKLPAIEALK